MKSTIFLVLICCVFSINGDPISNCSNRLKCEACIANPECAWCLDPQIVAGSRCFNPATYNSACREEYTYNPMNIIEILKAKNPSFISSSDSFSSNHQNPYSNLKAFERNYLTPEHIRVTMRVGEELHFRATFVAKEDFPVDIYVIMDLIKQAGNKEQQMNNLASNIVDTIRGITSDFHVGLGYISGNDRPIIHQVSMIADTDIFLHNVEQVGERMVSAGAPLGAIVETVCSGTIGWRSKSQKIIIFATDRNYEGLTDANIEEKKSICSGDFNSQRDYHISQINDLLKEKQIKVVFAVTNDVIDKYKELQNHIDNSIVTNLTTGPSNIGSILRDFYTQQSMNISLRDNSTNFLNIRYFTNCKTERQTETNKCDFVKLGDQVTYVIKLKALSCPANPSDQYHKIQIFPENLTGQLTIEVKMFCSCPVEKQMCYGRGHIENGVCKCKENFYGDDCECAGVKPLRNECRPNDTVSVDCSGRGTCECDKCLCHERENPREEIYGQYCEIDNYSCPEEFEVCSGRGQCIHGQCVCFENWAGPLCTNRNTICINPSGRTSSDCSGHGMCKNNTCVCFKSNIGRYYGDYCENYEDKTCSINGRLVNGRCVCDANYFGEYCEYTRGNLDDCKLHHSTSMECSGRGSCVCGVCECEIRVDPNEVIYGRYCECDNFSCFYGDGLLCSGHGTCICGQCHCNDQWSGGSCNCSTSTDTCIPPFGNNRTICSGHGKCECGACQCVEDKNVRYVGTYCEIGPVNIRKNSAQCNKDL